MNNLLQKINLLGDNIPWLHDFRQKGGETYMLNGIPSAKTEAWKYTKPNMFFANDFTAASSPEIIDDYTCDVPFDAFKIYFINGQFSPALSNLPSEVEVLPIIEAIMFQPSIRDKIGHICSNCQHPFAALNSFSLDGHFPLQRQRMRGMRIIR